MTWPTLRQLLTIVDNFLFFSPFLNFFDNIDNFQQFWQFWNLLTICESFYNFDFFVFFLTILTMFNNVDNFWQFSTMLTIFDNFQQYWFLFWQCLQFLTILTIFDNFDKFGQFWPFLQFWQFLTIQTIDNLFNNFDNCFFPFWQLKRQSWIIVKFETLIINLTIENLNSWQYFSLTFNCDTGQHSQFLRCFYHFSFDFLPPTTIPDICHGCQSGEKF